MSRCDDKALLDPTKITALLASNPVEFVGGFANQMAGALEAVFPADNVMALLGPVLGGGDAIGPAIAGVMKEAIGGMMAKADVRPSPSPSPSTNLERTARAISSFERERDLGRAVDLEAAADRALAAHPLVRRGAAMDLRLERLSDADADKVAEAVYKVAKDFLTAAGSLEFMPATLRCVVTDAALPLLPILKEPLVAVAKLGIKRTSKLQRAPSLHDHSAQWLLSLSSAFL